MIEIASKLDSNTLSHALDFLTSGYELRLIMNFLFCIVVGLIIGGDREKKGKAAGVSTISLVACGSMLFTFLSGMTDFGDPTRIAAGIAQGIGFLGAGIIITRKDGNAKRVGNLTTAASIWFTAAIGMTIGFELYSLALISVAFTYIIFRFLPHFDNGEADNESD